MHAQREHGVLTLQAHGWTVGWMVGWLLMAEVLADDLLMI